MSFSVGIVGLPNVGKSTLFKSLTRKDVKIAPRPFTTINPNVGIVAVPDERLEKISQIVKPEKTTFTAIEFIDIAGLVKDAHKGAGLGNQFLAQIRNCDAILEVIRAFQSQEIENVLGEINPEKEKGVVKTELLMKDLETLEKLLSKSEGKKTPELINALTKVKETVSQGKMISSAILNEKEQSLLKEYQFLTNKPILFALNTDNPDQATNDQYLTLNLKEEEEFSELSEKEKEEIGFKSCLNQIISGCYNLLDLITFFTIKGEKEVRAWTIKKGSPCWEAGDIVHSDFKNFIKAEITNWENLIENNSWSKVKEKGLIKTVSRNYIIEDGDIVEFKI